MDSEPIHDVSSEMTWHSSAAYEKFGKGPEKSWAVDRTAKCHTSRGAIFCGRVFTGLRKPGRFECRSEPEKIWEFLCLIAASRAMGSQRRPREIALADCSHVHKMKDEPTFQEREQARLTKIIMVRAKEKSRSRRLSSNKFFGVADGARTQIVGEWRGSPGIYTVDSKGI